MAFVITEPCKGVKDASCVGVCPVDCIETSEEDDMYYIDPEVCIDCAYCVSVCPVKRNLRRIRRAAPVAELRPQEQRVFQGPVDKARPLDYVPAGSITAPSIEWLANWPRILV